MKNITLNKTDIEKIHVVADKFGIDEFELTKDGSSGIGYTLDMTFWTTIKEELCQVTVPITTPTDW